MVLTHELLSLTSPGHFKCPEWKVDYFCSHNYPQLCTSHEKFIIIIITLTTTIIILWFSPLNQSRVRLYMRSSSFRISIADPEFYFFFQKIQHFYVKKCFISYLLPFYALLPPRSSGQCNGTFPNFFLTSSCMQGCCEGAHHLVQK